jgi:murein DD-endopeptidase MepM/ murein hydrolase activator NlpD
VSVKPVALVIAAVTLVAASLCAAPAARAAPWERPVRGPVVRPFVLSADRFARGQHRGIDVAAQVGSAVRAACGGRVRFAGRVPAGGLTVSVGCGPLVATYQHLGTIAVRRGRLLAAGAAVGTVGRSGDPRDRRPHLHLGARDAATGRYIDPLALLGAGPVRAPPVVPAPRRPVPLGPAPPPAPRPAPRPAPALPLAPAVDPRVAPGRPPALVVWSGLVVLGLGLPLGGLARLCRRRHSRAPCASGWAPAHR